ncbi:MAG: CapA family protein [Ignavibacteria bacterium]
MIDKPKSYFPLKLILITSYLFSVVILCGCDNKNSKKDHSDKDEKQTLKKDSALVDTDSLYSIIMVGDVMMGTNYPSEYSLPPNDGEDILEGPSEFLQIADVTIGNLEGTLLDKGGTPKECLNPENCAAFRMPEHYAEYLKNSGFDIMSVANNHSGDMGDIGRKSTVKTLERYEIKYAGYVTCPVTIFLKDGVKFGFTAFAPNTGTQNINDLSSARKTIKDLKGKCDIVIVAFHGGAEGSGALRVTRNREYYLGEDRGNIYDFAHAMIDAGSDIVFGQGPHVPRAIELYNDRIIAYSLGNFCTYGKFGLSGNLGLAPILKIYINQKGEFQGGRIYPFRQIKRGIPVFDDDYEAVSLIKHLSESDFPESKLVIQSDGKLIAR